MSIYKTGRTALFSPADRPERAIKALNGTADLAIVDLEDAVAPADKDAARSELESLLRTTTRTTGIVIRINDPASDVGGADIQEICRLIQEESMPDIAVMVPKFTASTNLEQLPQGVAVIGLIESAHAVRDIYALAAHPAITRLALGAVDLSTELGCEPRSATIDTVRSQIVIASVAAHLSAPLESPCVNFRDETVVFDAAQRARQDGFGGMLCIHPAQLSTVHSAFAPSEKDIEWAHRVLAAGDSAAAVDGEMVDRPVLLRAQRILESV